eukprot:TRINITY_DN38103_c0_g1_i2.p2 TRINITY_DN38103_c0_g1~~TRINITY_DN38103_c0_g1_i2.p2  ORF type:complete len:207 (+),score=72.87 TRINITY_DN38103_c0_g1_i2:74-622(+)
MTVPAAADAGAAGEPCLFVYGSLMWRSVLSAVIGRVPAARGALLAGYRRRKVAGQPYPALVSDPQSVDPVRGLLLSGLAEAEQRVLDFFEDDEYRRVAVRVRAADCGGDPFGWAQADPGAPVSTALEELPAMAYVFPPSKAALLEECDWLPSRDFTPHEDSYVSMCSEFAADPEVQRLSGAC